MTRTFGCCSELPEHLLHTGDRWDYPKWYINYLLGQGKRDLPKQAEKALEYLKDGTWKVYLGGSVGTGTIEACVELELIEMDKVRKPYSSFVVGKNNGIITDIGNLKEFSELFNEPGNGFIGAYRITERGKQALDNNYI
jgi:hypothetical protein